MLLMGRFLLRYEEMYKVFGKIMLRCLQDTWVWNREKYEKGSYRLFNKNESSLVGRWKIKSQGGENPDTQSHDFHVKHSLSFRPTLYVDCRDEPSSVPVPSATMIR